MARARYCHILGFLHFTDNNRNGDDGTDCRKYETRGTTVQQWGHGIFNMAAGE